MKKTILAGLAAMVAIGSTMAIAGSSEPPYPTDPYINIVRYYGSAIGVPPGGLVGWDINYCDLTVESHREPAANINEIAVEDGSCF